MARRSSHSRKCSALFFLSVVCIVFWPQITQAFPRPAALVSATFVWTYTELLLELSAAAFLTVAALFGILVRDAYRWLTRPSPLDSPTPEALEEGKAPRIFEAPSEGSEAAPAAIEDIPPSTMELTTAGKLAGLLLCAALFSADLYLRGIVSREQPVLENAGAALMHLLGGLAVLAVLLLALLGFMVKMSRGGRWGGSETLAAGEAVLNDVERETETVEQPAVEEKFDLNESVDQMV
ncbi:hypothetical protein DFH09DRAFT_1121247 [Mycena vulgaris]|nr:hypothetical protein DFH09DRAFT_1121247 [Mycena vulgaris]